MDLMEFDIRNLVVNKQVIFVPNRRVIPHKDHLSKHLQRNLGFSPSSWENEDLTRKTWRFMLSYHELPYFCRRNWDVALNNQDLSISCLNWN